MEPGNFSKQPLYLNLMLLVLDVEMVKYFPFFCLCKVGVSGLGVEFPFPDFDFAVLLLNKLDKVFIFVDKMSVLGEK